MDWAKAGTGKQEAHRASVVRRSRRAAKASPRLDRSALVVPASRASRGRSAALPHLPDLSGGPTAAFTGDPHRSPGSRDRRRTVPPPLKAAAPATGEIGPGAPPPSGCGLGRSGEGRYRAGGPAWPFKPRPRGRGRRRGWGARQVTGVLDWAPFTLSLLAGPGPRSVKEGRSAAAVGVSTRPASLVGRDPAREEWRARRDFLPRSLPGVPLSPGRGRRQDTS